jgi:hypothetical protein
MKQIYLTDLQRDVHPSVVPFPTFSFPTPFGGLENLDDWIESVISQHAGLITHGTPKTPDSQPTPSPAATSASQGSLPTEAPSVPTSTSTDEGLIAHGTPNAPDTQGTSSSTTSAPQSQPTTDTKSAQATSDCEKIVHG